MEENISDVEDCIKLIENKLYFGKNPKNLKVIPNNVNVIIDLRLIKEKPWYYSKLKEGVTYVNDYILEDRSGEEKDDEEILKVCNNISLNYFSKKETVIFIHGQTSTQFACIIALIVWNVKKPIEKLHEEIFKNIQNICLNYPETPELTKQLQRVLKKKTDNANNGIKKFFF
jgi:hypothetical protein